MSYINYIEVSSISVCFTSLNIATILNEIFQVSPNYIKCYYEADPELLESNPVEWYRNTRQRVRFPCNFAETELAYTMLQLLKTNGGYCEVRFREFPGSSDESYWSIYSCSEEDYHEEPLWIIEPAYVFSTKAKNDSFVDKENDYYVEDYYVQEEYRVQKSLDELIQEDQIACQKRYNIDYSDDDSHVLKIQPLTIKKNKKPYNPEGQKMRDIANEYIRQHTRPELMSNHGTTYFVSDDVSEEEGNDSMSEISLGSSRFDDEDYIVPVIDNM